jgi:hypothetical protein
MTKQYMTAFPDFDNGDTFDALFAALEPMGFVDDSWHNDASPCIMYQEPDNEYGNIKVWVDYFDRNLRECPETIADIFVVVDDSYDTDGFNKDFTSVADALTYIRMHYMELERCMIINAR